MKFHEEPWLDKLVQVAILIFLVVGISATFLSWSGEFSEPRRTEWTERMAVNFSAWKQVQDSSFTSVGGVVTLPFFLNVNGTGQILIINPDPNDTLMASFDDGINWTPILPDFGSWNPNPANYDSIHFKVFATATSDSIIVPYLAWTIYSGDTNAR